MWPNSRVITFNIPETSWAVRDSHSAEAVSREDAKQELANVQGEPDVSVVLHTAPRGYFALPALLLISP